MWLYPGLTACVDMGVLGGARGVFLGVGWGLLLFPFKDERGGKKGVVGVDDDGLLLGRSGLV